MKNLKKFATICCVALFAILALNLASCKDDKNEPLTNKKILTSRQWEMSDADTDIPAILDISYSSKGKIIYAMFYGQLSAKETFPILSITDGDFNGYEFKITSNSDIFPIIYAKVNDENSITIKMGEEGDAFTLYRIESKIDLSQVPEVDLSEMM